MKLIRNPYKTLPYQTLVEQKCPWLDDMTTHVRSRIAEFDKFMRAEAECDGQPELTDPNYLIERFNFNCEHNMYYGNFKILKYFVLMFKMKILYLMIGQWHFTDFDVTLYNYFRDTNLSKWSHQSVKWVLMYTSGKSPSILPHTKDSKWYLSYQDGDDVKDEFYTNLFRKHFVLFDDSLRNIKQLELSYPSETIFNQPPAFPDIVSVEPSDPMCGSVCTCELSFLKGELVARRYQKTRDHQLEQAKSRKRWADEEQRAKSKEYNEQHKDHLTKYFHDYNIKNKEKISTYKKQYAIDHKDEITAKNKKRYAEHKEEERIKGKLYREANREKVNAASRNYYHTHQDEQKVIRKAYRDTHKEQIKAQNDRYRAENRDKILARRKEAADTKRAAGYRYRFCQETGKYQWVFVGIEPPKEQTPDTPEQIARREYGREYRKKNKDKIDAHVKEYKAKRRAGYQRVLNPETGKKEWTFVGLPETVTT